MAVYPTYPRRRYGRKRSIQIPTNSGICANCGQTVGWRSVSNRCRRCELEFLKERLPLYVDLNVLT